MRRILLVARHEFIKYVTRRGFLIGVFLMPLWIVLAAVVPKIIEESVPPRVFTVVDRAGGYAEAVDKAIRARDTREALTALSAYAKVHVDMNALRAHMPGLATILAAPDGDTDAAAALRRAGGAAFAAKAMQNYVKPGTPPFVPEVPHLQYAFAPPALMTAARREFPARVAKFLSDGGGLDAVVVLPPGFGHTAEAEYWTTGAPKPELKNFIEQTLTDTLRKRALREITPAQSASILDISAQLHSYDPTGRGAGHELSLQDKAQRYAPSAIAFLLILTIFMNAASLMSAVIEEKSNRIVEVLLSCVTPRQFMTGKLLGAAGAAFFTLAIWLTIAVLAVYFFISDGTAMIGAIAYSLMAGPMMAMLFLCFVCGLLIYASLFLAIGSMANSVQDAQAFLGPTVIVVMAPLLIMPALLQDPNGTIATAMTWVPIYTPFFLMFRLPWHPPILQVAGALLLMVATAAVLVLQMGRVFANNVLTAERPPRFGMVLRTLLGLNKAL